MSDATTPTPEIVVNPPLPDPRPDAGAILLPPNLAGLVKLAGKEESRYAMTGVLLEITPTGYRAVATDGHYLGLVEGPPVGDAKDYPDLPGLKSASNGATQGIIPSQAWAEAFKMIPKRAKNVGKYKPIFNSLVCILGANEANFGATDLEQAPVRYTRLLEGRFPDYRQAFPKPPPQVVIRLDPLRLAELLRVASAFSSADNCAVTLEIHTPTTPFVIRAQNGEQQFTGLCMPLP